MKLLAMSIKAMEADAKRTRGSRRRLESRSGSASSLRSRVVEGGAVMEPGGHVLVHEHVARGVEDADVHGACMQIDSAVPSPKR
jgi:hypothetical protein